MIELTDAPFFVQLKFSAGGACNYTESIDVPGIIIERSCLWTSEEVSADKKDVKNILRYFGVLKGENYEIYEEKISILSDIFLSVGKIDEFYKLQGNRLDKQTISRIVELLELFSKNINNRGSGTVIYKLSDECASRFDDMRIKELKTLDLSTIP